MELTLVLTRDCNLGCAYCYAGDKVRERMDPALGRRAIDWALGRCRPGASLRMGYFGGEPLLAWDLLTDLHAYARTAAAARGVTLNGTVTTNATLLDDARMAWLDDHGVVVGVSLDGRPETHDAARPRKGGGASSPGVLRGLAAALRRQPLCQVLAVVGPGSVRQLAANAEFIVDQGVRVLGLNLDHTAAWDLDDLAAYREQLELVGDRWLTELRAGRDVWVDQIDGKIAARIKGGLEGCDQCSAGLDELAIAPSGRWYPCERLVGDDGPAQAAWCLGDAHASADGGPDPIRTAAFLRRHGTLPDDCAACAHRDRCQNGCACSNIMATGEPALPGGLLCASEQIGIAVADRVGAAAWAERLPLFLAKHYRAQAG